MCKYLDCWWRITFISIRIDSRWEEDGGRHCLIVMASELSASSSCGDLSVETCSRHATAKSVQQPIEQPQNVQKPSFLGTQSALEVTYSGLSSKCVSLFALCRKFRRTSTNNAAALFIVSSALLGLQRSNDSIQSDLKAKSQQEAEERLISAKNREMHLLESIYSSPSSYPSPRECAVGGYDFRTPWSVYLCFVDDPRGAGSWSIRGQRLCRADGKNLATRHMHQMSGL